MAAAAAPGHRIVGGEETSIERYPSIVQLDYLRPLTGWGQSCAGTIVTPTVVVSAAHCTKYVPAHVLTVAPLRTSTCAELELGMQRDNYCFT